jgi:hypothetical protein
MAPHRTIPQRLTDHDELLNEILARLDALENPPAKPAAKPKPSETPT